MRLKRKRLKALLVFLFVCFYGRLLKNNLFSSFSTRTTEIRLIQQAQEKEENTYSTLEIGCRGVECCIEREENGIVKCFVAKIEVRHNVSLQLWDDRSNGSWRLRYQLSEAVRTHPFLRWTQVGESADIILWLPSLAASPPSNLSLIDARHKLVILDEHDLPAPKGLRRVSNGYLAFFKRSFAVKRDGRLLDSQGSLYSLEPLPVVPFYSQYTNYRFFAFQYALSDAYLGKNFQVPTLWSHREYHIVCTLRVGRGQFQARARVLNWTRQAMLSDETLTGYAGEFDKGSRLDINLEYFELMRKAKIVVTTQPGEWDGDYRSMEAFSSGALVFADVALTHAPSPYPFVPGSHYIQFDPIQGNRNDFLQKLRYYLDRPQLAERIAANGFEHALKYHRSISRLDWILRSAFAEDIRGRALYSYNETARTIRDNTPRIIHGSKNNGRQGQKESEKKEVLDVAAISSLRIPLDRRYKQK
uniref:Spore protein YkvP/CgeB glycosyl transferase-like domain-containing protein n=1 Tax=Aureoumbra lagunensis TaxID=44058 RepID=A0A7S3NK26_9STRA